MDENLRNAAEKGNIDALYAFIRRDPLVLDKIDEIPFLETPLHIAAFAGHTRFAVEVMKLKPSFARKLNQDGFSPMHLALQRNLTQLVDRLLDVDKDLVRVPGREGVTPFHYAAQTGNLKFLNLCIKICPKSFEDVTNRGENVLHIALKNDMVEAFLFLIKRVRRTWLIKDALLLEEKLLYCQDDEGNTLLHIAISKCQPQAVSWLVDRGLVDLKAKNLVGFTVFDILGLQTEVNNQRIRGILQQRPVRRLTARVVDYLISPFQLIEKYYVNIRRRQTVITDERLNALLVVGALLITVTFQAALTPPKNGQNLFLLLNALTYCLTTLTLFVLIPPGLIGIVLYVLLLLLFACFCVSTLGITAHHIIFIALSVLFGFTLLSLVAYYGLTFAIRDQLSVA